MGFGNWQLGGFWASCDDLSPLPSRAWPLVIISFLKRRNIRDWATKKRAGPPGPEPPIF